MEDISLTIEDCEVLIESIDSWRNRRVSGEMMSDIMSSIFSDKLPPEKMAEIEKEREKKKEAIRIKEQRESDIAILLKAKLVMIKRKLQEAQLPKL